MSVASYAIDALFVVRVIKFLGANPDRKWSNTYEFQATVAGSEDELLQAGLAVVDFEAKLAKPTVIFDRLQISTWEADSKPYAPEVFISSTLTTTGQRAGSGEVLPLTSAVSLARVAPYGRFGHLFLRAMLEEGDTSAPAGKAILTNRADIQTAVATALTSSGLDDFVGTSATGGMRLVLVGKTAAAVRPVVGLAVQGITQLPVDHAWFNRKPPVGP